MAQGGKLHILMNHLTPTSPLGLLEPSCFSSALTEIQWPLAQHNQNLRAVSETTWPVCMREGNPLTGRQTSGSPVFRSSPSSVFCMLCYHQPHTHPWAKHLSHCCVSSEDTPRKQSPTVVLPAKRTWSISANRHVPKAEEPRPLRGVRSIAVHKAIHRIALQFRSETPRGYSQSDTLRAWIPRKGVRNCGARLRRERKRAREKFYGQTYCSVAKGVFGFGREQILLDWSTIFRAAAT